MLRKVILLGVLLTWLVLADSSQAGLVFEFAVGGTLQTSINIGGVGQEVDIQVYLSQTGTTTILTDDGLAFAGIQVTFNSPGGIAAVQAVGDIHENVDPMNPIAFDTLIGKAVTSSTADLNEARFLAPLAVFPDVADPDRILLGTFTFTGLTLGTTVISVTDLDPILDDIVTGVNQSLDGQITPGSATLTVTPEPNSMGLWLVIVGAGSVVASYRARRRRKLQAADDGDPAAASSL